jgi:chromosome segregation ATPase
MVSNLLFFLQILTDANVITFVQWLIGALSTALLAAIGYIVSKFLAEQKATRTEFKLATEHFTTQISDFTNALNNKFKALNYYAKEADKKVLEHSLKLQSLEKDLENAHMRLQHISKQSTEHEVKINTILGKK